MSALRRRGLRRYVGPYRRLAVLCCSLLARVQADPQTTAADAKRVRFNEDIRPIFAEHCVACHGGVKQASGLSFVYHENVLAGGESGAPAVVPGDPEASYLLERVTDPDPESRMPPAEHGPPLSADGNRSVETLDCPRRRMGAAVGVCAAAGDAHCPRSSAPIGVSIRWTILFWPVWSWQGCSRRLRPSVSNGCAAYRSTWLVCRRLLEDVDAFLADQQPGAYERVVDRLLASPHFGERWASMWLDLARYADTTGYEADPHRDIWPYRDWVIRAFNEDMPYDEFTIKQLAGDLLESANDRRSAGHGVPPQYANQYRRRHRR